MRCGLLFAATLSVLVATPATAQSSRFFRANADGTGNCVFSPQPLPFNQESAPGYAAITTSFTEGQNVHVRCYFPKPLSAFRPIGKMSNSIRDKDEYYYGLIWERPKDFGGSHPDFHIVDLATPNAKGMLSNVTQRFDIYQESDCDFAIPATDLTKYGVTSPHRCIDLAAFARAMQREYPDHARSPFRFCVYQYVEAVDENATFRTWDPTLSKYRVDTKPRLYKALMTRGCFDYAIADAR